MSNIRLHLSNPRSARRSGARRPLGRYLVDTGVITHRDLLHALDLQRRVDAPLGEILTSEGLADPEDILLALSEQHAAQLVDLARDPPNAELASLIPVELCLKYQAVAWMSMGGAILVATSKPHQFEALRLSLNQADLILLPVIAEQGQIREQISRLYGATLAEAAATRVPDQMSCRTWNITSWKRRTWALAALGAFAGLTIAAPLWTITALIFGAFASMVLTTVLKGAALVAQITHKMAETSATYLPKNSMPYRLPKVSVLVPLLQEKEIAGSLITRLSRLTYPKSQLEVVLVLEAGDTITRDTLACTALPPWISVIEVPQANKLTTKPRALNYALDFCQGSIIGVWDAEDAPEPDQIERVVSRFQHAPSNVACLQGILDYYNSKANWLSRCFTIEYAGWWRVILPGVARMGLVIPLGGTTLFFRRSILETLKGWDAHNVTEDADLGVRLARRGYVTELIPTVTHEEANCRIWPWIRQRSRWLKGFLITWCVHMRDPVKLYKELGLMRFMGVQTMLFATFSQFALAPFLWSFWLTLAGLSHPIELVMGPVVMWSMVAVFILSETLNLGLSIVAVSGREHRHLAWWVFTMPLYFPLGTCAAAKALYEFVVSPFFWDKTTHGVTPDPALPPPLAPAVPPPA